jgi:hypothetical protein
MKKKMILEQGDVEQWDIVAKWSGMEENISISFEPVEMEGFKVWISGSSVHKTRLFVGGRIGIRDIFFFPGCESIEDILKEKLHAIVKKKIDRNSAKLTTLIWSLFELSEKDIDS